MKKIILLATILLIAGSVSAQTFLNSDRADLSGAGLPSVTFEAGAALSSTTGGTNFNTSGLAGFTAGFSFDLPVNTTLAIVPEILYSQKGYSANTPFGNFTLRSQFIDAPLLAKFHAGSRINFYVGPQVSYMIASSSKFSSGFSSAAQQNYDISGSNLLVDGVVGMGINISHTIELHARYAVDLQGRNTNGNSFVPAYRNQALQMGFGFKLN
ncbi:outer membrane beta-barrel protein [Mucilaginibacter sp.]|uniref:outer membrane beta-barrel protein n=1 Tax=Mucilaginibacter sp. TaxID=1882438 RepID=UPI002615260A|nr:outer membrane beta-barrel protein [Mucilaginibacter sp.]